MNAEELNAEIKKLRDDINGSHLAEEAKQQLLNDENLKPVAKKLAARYCASQAEAVGKIHDKLVEAKRKLKDERNGNGTKPPLPGGSGNDLQNKPRIETNGEGKPTPEIEENLLSGPITPETFDAIWDIQGRLPTDFRKARGELNKLTEQQARQWLATCKQRRAELAQKRSEEFDAKVNTAVEKRTNALQQMLEAFEGCGRQLGIDRATPEQLTEAIKNLKADHDAKETQRAALEAEIREAGTEPGKLVASVGLKSRVPALTKEKVDGAVAKTRTMNRVLGTVIAVLVVLGVMWGSVSMFGDNTASPAVPVGDTGYLKPLSPVNSGD